MQKIYDKIVWNNNTTPALNEDNLNQMSDALDKIDKRVVDLAGTIMETVPRIIELYDDIETLTENPPYIGANGNWWVWDTSTGAYVDSGVDASISITIGTTSTLSAGSNATVTNSGTSTDPIFNFGIPQGVAGTPGTDGQDGVSPGVTIDTITGGHRVTITDADHPTGQSFDVMDGESSGTWANISGKPFSSVGNGLTVSSDTLTANVKSVSVDSTGTASSTGVNYQRVNINGMGYEIKGTKYMEQTVTLSTSADTVVNFNSVEIKNNSLVDVYTNDPNLTYKTMSIYKYSQADEAPGNCDITFEKQSSAKTIKVRIYIK